MCIEQKRKLNIPTVNSQLVFINVSTLEKNSKIV